ncbi:MAG: RHS repeat domain-containing protein, partial [Mucilaginibacter sp.]
TTSYNRHTTTSGTRAMFIQVGGGGTTTDVTVYDNTWTIPSTNVCYGFSGWYLKDQDINHKLELYINGNLVGTQLIPYQGYPPIVPIWKVLDFSGATWNNSSAATSMHVVIKAKPTPPGYLSGTLTSFLGFDDFAICELPCGVMPCVNSMQPDTMPVITYTNPCQQLALDAAVNDGMDDFSNYIDSIKTGFVEAYVKKCMGSVIENFGLSYAAGEYQYTLYYYDQAGNLVRTVPPRGYSAVPALSIPTVRNDRAIYPASKSYYTTHSLYTTYTYNSLNQLVKQESPDANTSHFWYDKLGRLVASQNAEQAVSTSPYKYSYTVYDPLGRIDEVGQMGVTGIDFNATALNTLNGYLNASNYPANLTPTKEQITSTFYGDDAAYTITGVNLLPTALSSPQDYIRGRVAAVTIEDVDDSNPLTYDHGTYYNYDIHGNVKELVQHNPDMSFISGQDQKLLQYDYDLISGKVNTVSYQAGKPDQFFHMYEYDADNRLTNAYSSKDNVIWDQDAKYWYYKHGPLARVEIGDCKNQGFDYAYTVQGWIKGANSNLLRTPVDIGKDGQASGTSNYNTLHKWFSKDAYGYSLNYFSRTGASGTFYDYLAINGSSGSASTSFVGDFITNLGTTMNTNGPPLFNGNISHMVSAYVNNDPSATLIGGGSLATFTAYQMLSAYRYDQLNRIATSRVYKHLGSTTNVWAATADVAYGENFMYDMNGNITAVKRSGTATTGFPDMDNLTYNYPSTSNKLDYVGDGISSTAYTDDIDNQTTGNYTYDNNGNLIGDVVEEIQNIGWSVYGKMKTLTRISTSTRPELTFKYDASGNRVSKRVHIPGNPSTSDVIYYYLRDAQGNVMAVYQQHQLRSSQRLDLQEQHVYGSSRLGLLNNLINMNFATLPGAATSRVMGIKSYELTNHLGNVMSVFTDRKIPFETSPGSGVIGHYASDIINHQDYYAFGANKPGRTYASSSAYRYSFNDKEQDGESVSTSGNTQDYGARIYNPSLGKFLSVDPLTKKYPELTPYQFASNTPIWCLDLDGLEGLIGIVRNATGSDKNNQTLANGRVIPTGDISGSTYVIGTTFQPLTQGGTYLRVIQININEALNDNWGTHVTKLADIPLPIVAQRPNPSNIYISEFNVTTVLNGSLLNEVQKNTTRYLTELLPNETVSSIDVSIPQTKGLTGKQLEKFKKDVTRTVRQQLNNAGLNGKAIPILFNQTASTNNNSSGSGNFAIQANGVRNIFSTNDLAGDLSNLGINAGVISSIIQAIQNLNAGQPINTSDANIKTTKNPTTDIGTK